MANKSDFPFADSDGDTLSDTPGKGEEELGHSFTACALLLGSLSSLARLLLIYCDAPLRMCERVTTWQSRDKGAAESCTTPRGNR